MSHRPGSLSAAGSTDRQVRVEYLVHKYPIFFTFGIPALATACALLVALFVARHTDAPVFVFFVMSSAVSAWIAGPRAGIVALLLSWCAAVLFLFAPIYPYPVSLSNSLVRLGSISAVAVFVIVIIWRLRVSEERTRQVSAIVDSSDEAIIGMALDGTITTWNLGAERLYGYTAEEMKGASIDLLLPPDREGEVVQGLRKLEEGERFETYETQRRTKQGELIDVAVRLSPIHDALGVMIGASSLARDITRHRQAEEQLRSSQQLLSEAEGLSHTGAWDWDLRSQRWTFSNEWQKITGSSGESLSATGLLDLVHPDDREMVYRAFDEARSGGTRFESEYRFIRQNDRQLRTARVRGQFVRNSSGEVTRVYGFVQDVTDQRKAEQALRNRTAELESLLANAPVGFALFDSEHRFLRVNPALSEINGIPAQDHIGKKMSEVLPVNAVTVDPVLDQVFRTGRAVEREIAGETPKEPHVTRYWLTGFYPVFSDGTAPNAVGAYVVEITDRKRAEQALRSSEQRLRKFYESGMVGVIHWNMDGAIIDANDKFLEIVGYSRADLLAGRVSWANMTPPEYVESDKIALQELKKTGYDTVYEKEYIRKDGTRVPVVIGAAMLDEARYEGVAFVLDNTERKQAENALIRSEKLASVGRMAATVAHEINNPLEMIMNSVYLASLDDKLSPMSRENLAIAERELERVAHLTRQTLGFYRENASPVEVDATALVREIVELYGPKFVHRDITVQSEDIEGLCVQAIAGEIRQVVSNIISNAIDATCRGGRIRVRTGRVHIGGRSWVRITVGDTGEGIRRENLNRIFEAFFTTKQSVGTGLGLWVSNEIVTRHEGKLRVRSRRGQGTVFSVWLPEVVNPSRHVPKGEESSRGSTCVGGG